jgi:hypothetical protein
MQHGWQLLKNCTQLDNSRVQMQVQELRILVETPELKMYRMQTSRK